MLTTNIEGLAGEEPDKLWSVALFGAREPFGVLRASMASIVQAANRHTLLDVLVNGNAALAEQFARFAGACTDLGNVRIRVWLIELGDKAHAWNQYVHHIWPGGSLTFFVDGYVHLYPSAIERLGTSVEGSSVALGGSGIPASGWSAKSLRQAMLSHGGFHGNFCCIKGATIEELKRRRFRLPLGIYRVDSTLGAVLSFGLDPSRNAWDRQRIHIQEDAAWYVEQKRWWRMSDLIGQLKRVQRQAQGRLENLAVQHHLAIQRRAPELLPSTVQELVLAWIDRCPGHATSVMAWRPLCRRAANRLRDRKDWFGASVLPIQLA